MKLSQDDQLPQPQSPYGSRPIWELTPAEFADFQVTPLSKGGDSIWRCAPSTTGQKPSKSQVNWGMALLDGSHLTDLRHTARLTWTRKLMALVLCSPSNGNAPAPLSVPKFQLGFKWLISWMAMRGVQTPDELDVKAYIDGGFQRK